MQYVGAVVGAVIGFYVGGVSGAIYGAQLGYGIGAIVQASNEKIVTEGPRLSDLHVTISSNGAFIPRVYVYTGGMGGNIIDSTDLQPTTKDVEQDSGGKGGPTQVSRQTTYAASFIVMICKSLGTHEVQWIKANGNLFFSRHPDADALTLVGQQSLVGSVTVYDGNGDQLPDPTLEAIHGVGNVPAYRGRLTVMLKDFQLEKFSNNVASTQLTFGVVENPLVAGNEQPLMISPDGYYAMMDDAGIWFFKTAESFLHIGARRTYSGQVYLDALDGSGPQPRGAFITSDSQHPNLEEFSVPGQICVAYRQFVTPDNDFNGEAISTKDVTVWRLSSGYHFDYQQVPYYNNDGTVILGYCTTKSLIDDGDSRARFYSPLGVALGDLTIGSVQAFRTTYPEPDGFGGFLNGKLHGYLSSRHLAATDGAVFAWAETLSQGAGVVRSWLALTLADGPEGTGEYTFTDARIAGMLVQNAVVYLLLETAFDSTLGFRYDLRVIHPGVSDNTFAGARWAYGQGRSIRLFLIGTRLEVVDPGKLVMSWTDDGTFTAHDLSSTAASHGTQLAETRVLRWHGPDYYITSYLRANGIGVGEHQEEIWVYSKSVAGTPQPLRFTIQKLHDEVGLPNCDFTLLPDSVLNPGYCVTRQASARVAIDYLRDLFRVDTAESADKIKYVLRGRGALRTLSLNDLGAVEGDISSGGAPQAVEWTLPDEYAQPRAVNLKYTAIDANFEVGTAIARRETTPSEEVVTLDVTAMMLTGDQAARLAEQALVDHAIAGETTKVITTYLHEDLETADPIIVPGKFKDRRGRITGKADKGGLVEWQLMRDDASTLEQFVVGGAATSKGTQTSISVEPLSIADFLNLPSLRAKDDDAGGYLFVSSTAPARAHGATGYDQVPDAARVIGSVVGREGVKGITTSVLGTFSGSGYDSGSFVDVQFPAGTELESTSRAAMQDQGKNIFLIGDEILGVMTTTALGSDVWRLHGGLLRALRGTELAMATHIAGEPVYWLTLSGLIRDKVAVAGPVSVAAVGAGRPLSDLKNHARKATNTSQAQIPFAPLYLTYGRGSGEQPMFFKWQGRSRKIQADPFDVKTDDLSLNPTYGIDSRFYQVRKSADPDFNTYKTFTIIGESGAYLRGARYYDYLLDDDLGPFYAKVALIGPDHLPGAFSEPIYVSDVPPLEFPYAFDSYFFLVPDGTTSMSGITFGGAAQVTSNRVVLTGGSDVVVLPLFATFESGFGIGRWAIRLLFKTSSSALQTLLYFGDPAAQGGLKLTIQAGVVKFWFGDYSASIPLMQSAPTSMNFADGVEHVIDIFSLSAGAYNAYGMKIDLESRGSQAFKNNNGGVQHGPVYLGNDPALTTGFVGTIGDVQAVPDLEPQ